ncbi:MAG TPA: PIN domain-containing protein [Pseudonocardiaceae bacterium]
MIGGKVLDASALAWLARRRPAALAWFDTARLVGIALYLPSLALAEVRAVRPDAAPILADLLSHPSVVLGEFDSATADRVDQLLLAANVFDALAGHVVHVARQRGWPALTADPGRLHRIHPTLEVDLL